MNADPLFFEPEPRRENLRRMTISQASDLWLGELERRGHSPRTIDHYRRLLDKFADKHPQLDVDELTSTLVRRFLDEQARLLNGAGRKSPATIAGSVGIVCGFFDWLTREQLVARNPVRRNGERIITRPRQVSAVDNDNVTTVSTADVAKLLAAAAGWEELITIHTLVYLGPRRRALSNARITDYDPVERTLLFREKGGKTIEKPVPDRLAELLDAAVTAGVYAEQDYLVPSFSEQRRPGDRDDRIIHRIVRRVADRAGVDTHVHALRAAFAVRFLEDKPGEVIALQELMGHRRVETTMVYLRRLDRRERMETVRDLDWGDGQGEIRTPVAGFPTKRLSRAPLSATQPPVPVSSQNASIPFESLLGGMVVDLEPSNHDITAVLTAGLKDAAAAPRKEPA